MVKHPRKVTQVGVDLLPTRDEYGRLYNPTLAEDDGVFCRGSHDWKPKGDGSMLCRRCDLYLPPGEWAAGAFQASLHPDKDQRSEADVARDLLRTGAQTTLDGKKKAHQRRLGP